MDGPEWERLEAQLWDILRADYSPDVWESIASLFREQENHPVHSREWREYTARIMAYLAEEKGRISPLLP